MKPQPWMAWLAVVIALAAAAGLQTVRLSKEQAAHAETKRSHAEAQVTAEKGARERETALQGDIDRLAGELAEEKEIAKSREDALVERVRTGERRLSVLANCPGQGAAGSGAAGGSRPGPQRAELDPAAAARILGIGRDGDNAIRERNACVAAYEAVRERLNAE